MSPPKSSSRPNTSSPNPAALFFRDAEQLLTLGGRTVPRRGRDLGELGIARGGALLAVDGKIAGAGRTRELESTARRLKARNIDCRGRVVMPGFVDSHTHLVFAGSRVDDYVKRLEGATYEEIASAGGGIRLTARLVAEASPRALLRQALGFLDEFAACGTTTAEVKTGYGLDVETEIKMLRVIHQLSAHPDAKVELVPTLLAAHALPAAFEGRRKDYLDAVINRLIPFAAARKLARFIDCFCDRGAFSVAECQRVLSAGAALGLVPRLHAEQLARTGGTRLALQVGAASADHLDHLTAADIRALARSETVATLLPGSNFHLGIRRYAPARRLIDAGAAVALATDFNPGTSPTVNMQFILSLACAAMHLTPAEAICAATLNAAHSLRMSERIGSLERGKQADVIVMDVDDYRKIPYYFASNHCVMTVKGGRIVHSRLDDARRRRV
ncbi:MAG TPA: imidazolonepropionase [Terriglobia bacterium]|nr:imidazolonepropionase [Terriglobia bacterium]